MILTIGFDSFLEKRYYLNEYGKSVLNQALSSEYDIDGKSINVARILNMMNLNVFTTGFLGGLNGEFIFNRLKDLHVYNDFIHIKDDTPDNVSVFSDEKLKLRIKESSPRITREELESFYKLYGDIVYKYKFICGLGDIPENVSEDIYFNLIKIAKDHGRKFILDASGIELSLGIEGIPFMVKLKVEDLEALSKIKINFEGEILKLAYPYIEKGIEIVVVDLNEKGSLVLTKDLAYRLDILEREDTLPCDKGYLVAGYALGLMKKYDIEMIMLLGQAMRIAYSKTIDISSIDMSDVKKAMGNIEIRKLNY